MQTTMMTHKSSQNTTIEFCAYLQTNRPCICIVCRGVPQSHSNKCAFIDNVGWGVIMSHPCARFGRGTFCCRPVYVGGEIKRRGATRTSIIPRAKERKRGDTIRTCERNANDNDDTQSSQNTIIKFDTDAYTFACGLAPIIQVHTIAQRRSRPYAITTTPRRLSKLPTADTSLNRV